MGSNETADEDGGANADVSLLSKSKGVACKARWLMTWCEYAAQSLVFNFQHARENSMVTGSERKLA